MAAEALIGAALGLDSARTPRIWPAGGAREGNTWRLSRSAALRFGARSGQGEVERGAQAVALLYRGGGRSWCRERGRGTGAWTAVVGR
jgi:hypothetical protein